MDHSPRNVGRLLDDAIAIYARSAGTILPAAVLLLFPVGLLQGIAYTLYVRSIVTLPFLSASPEALGFEQMTGAYGAALGVTAMAFPVYAVSIWFLSCLMAAGPRLERGDPMTTREFLAAGRSRFGHLLLSLVVSYVIIQVAVAVPYLIGVALLPLLPAMLVVALTASVVFTTMLSLVPGVTVVEGASLDTALQRSIRLALSDFKRALAFVLGLGIVWMGLRAAVTSPAALAHGVSIALTRPEAQFTPASWFWAGIQGLFSALALTLTLPLAYIGLYQFYLDMRARAEGLDLVERARKLQA